MRAGAHCNRTALALLLTGILCACSGSDRATTGLELLGAPPPCETNEDCATGSCVDEQCAPAPSPEPNNAPFAVAGESRVVATGELVTLDGSVSADPDGDALTFAWSLDELPEASSTELEGADTATPTFVPDLDGVYRAQLVVSDGLLASAPSSVVVFAQSPPAPAPPDEEEPEAVEGPAEEDVETEPQPPFDEGGACRSDLDCWSRVCREGLCGQNGAPLARAGEDLVGRIGETTSLDGSASADPDGDALTWRWVIASKPTGSEPELLDALSAQPKLTPDRAGLYVVLLVVGDGRVLSEPDAVELAVPIADGPVARLDVLSEPPYAPNEPIELSAAGTSHASGLDYELTWSILLEPEGSEAELVVAETDGVLTPDRIGAYVVQVTADDGERSDTASRVMIIEPENQGPTANAGEDRTVATDSLVTLDGSASSDPDDDDLSFSWHIVEAPEGGEHGLYGVDAERASLRTPSNGDYVVELVVRDGQEESLPVTVTITARPPDARLDAVRSWVSAGSVTLQHTPRALERITAHALEDGERGTGHALVGESLDPWRVPMRTGAIISGFWPVYEWRDGVGLVAAWLYNFNSETRAVVEPPLVLFPHGVFADVDVTSRAKALLADTDGDVTTTHLRSDVRLIGVGPLETAGGTFEYAVHVRQRLTVGVAGAVERDYWLVAGLGVVRQTRHMAAGTTTPDIKETVWSNLGAPDEAAWPSRPERQQVPRRTIAIDGSSTEWEGVPPYWIDLHDDRMNGEAPPGQDAAALHIAHDGQRVYVHLGVHDPPASSRAHFILEFIQNPPASTEGDTFLWAARTVTADGIDVGFRQNVDGALTPGIYDHLLAIGRTPEGYEISMPLDLVAHHGLPDMRAILTGCHVQVSVCPVNENHCTDSFGAPVRLDGLE